MLNTWPGKQGLSVDSLKGWQTDCRILMKTGWVSAAQLLWSITVPALTSGLVGWKPVRVSASLSTFVKPLSPAGLISAVTSSSEKTQGLLTQTPHPRSFFKKAFGQF